MQKLYCSLKYLTWKCCSFTKFSGAGCNAGEGASLDQATAINVAKECLLAALKTDPKSSHMWANLADAYYMTSDHKNATKCLEKVDVDHSVGCL